MMISMFAATHGYLWCPVCSLRGETLWYVLFRMRVPSDYAYGYIRLPTTANSEPFRNGNPSGLDIIEPELISNVRLKCGNV